MKFDWYEATVHDDDANYIISRLEEFYPNAIIRPVLPHHGYIAGRGFFESSAADQKPFLTVWWQGNPGVHVKATGAASRAFAERFRELWPTHSVTRADVCEDWSEPGLFDRMAAHFKKFAVAHGVKLSMQGDWERGEARTLYVGSQKSVAYICLYEKGYECGSGDRNHVRLEVRVRPHRKASKLVAASMSPVELLGTTRWLVSLFRELGFDWLQSRPLGTVRHLTDDERARLVLCKQYWRILTRWADDVGGFDNLGGAVQELIAQARRPAPLCEPSAAAQHACGDRDTFEAWLLSLPAAVPVLESLPSND